MQQRIKAFQEQHGLGMTPQTALLDLLSELGEVSKELLKSSNYGRAALPAEPGADLPGELGDALYSLMSLAISLNVDLEQALEQTLAKYERRFSHSGQIGSGR